MDAAREKKMVMYEQHKVKFFLDFSMEVDRQWRQFDGVKKRLQALNIEYRFRYLAKLTIRHGGQTMTCSTSEEVERLIEARNETSGQEEAI